MVVSESQQLGQTASESWRTRQVATTTRTGWLTSSIVPLQTGPAVEQAVRGVVLVPTKELARQAQSMIQQLAAYCARDIRVANVSAAEDSASQRWVKSTGLWGNEATQRRGVGFVCSKKGLVQGEVPATAFSPILRCCPPAELC